MLGIVVLCVLFLLVVSAVVDDLSTDTSSEDSGTETHTEPPAPAPPAPGSEAPPSEPPGFEDGTYVVGTDIPPGLYRAGGEGFCTWERLSDLSGNHDAVLAWEFSDGQTYAEILPTDVAFSTNGCGRWTPAAADGPDVSAGFGDGTFLVGSDIQPGTYRATGGSFCTWARLSGLSGDHDETLAWEFSDGQAYAEVMSTDVAFSANGCGTWSRIA